MTRKKTGKFLLEGQREIELATKGNYAIEKVLFCLDIATNDVLNTIKSSLPLNVEYLEVSKEVYQKIA